ncbi:MAG: XcyI family restriction endonuclease [Bacillota bacterium]
MDDPVFELDLPKPVAALGLADALERARRELLSDALLAAVAELDLEQVNRELALYVPSGRLKELAGRGLRGELLYPVPCILEARPRLIGYYRLLLGYSGKKAYRQIPGLGVFQDMERKGTLSDRQRSLLPILCRAFAQRCGDLVDGLGASRVTRELLDDLQLMTLGSSIQGRRNVEIGEEGAAEVKQMIEAIVKPFVTKITDSTIKLTNSAGREVTIRTGADPDVTIVERIGTDSHRKTVSIEIKAGEDVSNIYNRLGEAEKSHLKAKQQGFTEFWTIVNVFPLDEAKARVQTPTSNKFYVLSRLRDQHSPEYMDFRERIVAYTGIRS